MLTGLQTVLLIAAGISAIAGEKPRMYPEQVFAVIGKSARMVCIHAANTRARWSVNDSIISPENLEYHAKQDYGVTFSVHTIPRVKAYHNNTRFKCWLANGIKSESTLFAIEPATLVAMHPAKYGLPGIFCWSAPQAHQVGIAYSLSVLGVCPIMVLQPIVCSGCYSDCRQSQCFTVEDACSIDGKESQTGKAEYVVNLKTTRTAGSLNPLLDTQTVKLQNFNVGPGKANNNSWDIISVLTDERSYLQLNTSWKFPYAWLPERFKLQCLCTVKGKQVSLFSSTSYHPSALLTSITSINASAIESCTLTIVACLDGGSCCWKITAVHNFAVAALTKILVEKPAVTDTSSASNENVIPVYQVTTITLAVILGVVLLVVSIVGVGLLARAKCKPKVDPECIEEIPRGEANTYDTGNSCNPPNTCSSRVALAEDVGYMAMQAACQKNKMHGFDMKCGGRFLKPPPAQEQIYCEIPTRM
jgi:hypothetical protein